MTDNGLGIVPRETKQVIEPMTIFCTMRHSRDDAVIASFRMVRLKGDRRVQEQLLCRRHVAMWFDFALAKGEVAQFEVEVLR